jgi:hypothetical protein
LLEESGIAEEAVTTPRRSVRKVVGKMAIPVGITAPLAAVLAVSFLTTASGAALPGSTSATAKPASTVASRVAARGAYTQSASVSVADEKRISRDTQRPDLSEGFTAVPLKAKATRYSTSGLTVRQTPLKDAASLGTLSSGSEIKITDATFGSYQQILYKNKPGWVLASKLTSKKPASDASSASSSASGSVSEAPCRLGSAVESGLKAHTIEIYRSVCASFPAITSYGGVRADSMEWHPTGRALDIMLPSVSDVALGNQIVAFVIAHASEFNVNHIIYRQRVWLPGQGWSGMEDRGSITANHYDHVHVAVSS